jgi:hypothetical protein
MSATGHYRPSSAGFCLSAPSASPQKTDIPLAPAFMSTRPSHELPVTAAAQDGAVRAIRTAQRSRRRDTARPPSSPSRAPRCQNANGVVAHHFTSIACARSRSPRLATTEGKYLAPPFGNFCGRRLDRPTRGEEGPSVSAGGCYFRHHATTRLGACSETRLTANPQTLVRRLRT